MDKVSLKYFNNEWYSPGRGSFVRLTWYIVNVFILNSYLFPINGLKILLLKLFGAQIGKHVVIKPKVNIKYPWKLKVGDYTWIGEEVWIDNLAEVAIGTDCCLSQGAMLLCGNHDYKKVSFDLILGSIELKDGAWVGAKSVVCPGVTLFENSILSVASVANKDLDSFGIYKGNPAVKIKTRVLK